jgi:hypothetical protein
MATLGFIWLVCGIISAIIGSRKGRGCAAFFLGVLLGPLGIIFSVILIGDRKRCQFCQELIHKKALVCPHCQKEIDFKNTRNEVPQMEKRIQPPLGWSSFFNDILKLVIFALLALIILGIFARVFHFKF